jgi:hypothetical protein
MAPYHGRAAVFKVNLVPSEGGRDAMPLWLFSAYNVLTPAEFMLTRKAVKFSTYSLRDAVIAFPTFTDEDTAREVLHCIHVVQGL